MKIWGGLIAIITVSMTTSGYAHHEAAAIALAAPTKLGTAYAPYTVGIAGSPSTGDDDIIGVFAGVASFDAAVPLPEQQAQAAGDGTSFGVDFVKNFSSNIALGGELSFEFGSGRFGGQTDLDGDEVRQEEVSGGTFVQLRVPVIRFSEAQIVAWMRLGVIAGQQDITAYAMESSITKDESFVKGKFSVGFGVKADSYSIVWGATYMSQSAADINVGGLPVTVTGQPDYFMEVQFEY